jgi:hypothetical protein
MAIDPNIALGYRGIEAPNPLAQYAQAMQVQSAQNQNALNQMQMRAAQRGEQDTETMRNALAGVQYGTPDYDKALTGAFLKTGNVKGLQDYRKGENEASKAAAELQLKNLELQRDIFGNLAQNPSDENVKAHLQDMLIQKRITPQEANGWLTKTATMNPVQRKTLFTDLAMKANDRVGYEVSRSNNAATVGATIRGQDLLDARAKETLKISQENQRREGDPAFQQQMAEAKALGQNMAKDKALRTAQLPKVLDTAEMTLREIDDLIGKRNTEGKLLPGQKPHPGFETAVGATYLPGARFIPGAPATDFQKRFDQIKGGAFLQAFETLKGGGSITNVEGDKGTAALNRMDLAQSEKEFVQAAREFQDIVRKGVERASKMAGAPNTPTPAAPATPVPSVVRVPANAITNPQFPGFSITPGTP